MSAGNYDTQYEVQIATKVFEMVDTKYREMLYSNRHSAGPKLLTPTPFPGPVADIREHLTTTLSLPICAQSTTWTEGTSGSFVTENGNPDVLLLTARHIVFPPSENENRYFKHVDENQHRREVVLFGAAFKECHGSIRTGTSDKEPCERRIENVERQDGPVANGFHKRIQATLDETRDAMKEPEALREWRHFN